MSKHYDELINLLALIKQDFSFIGISETRSLCEEDDEPENIPLSSIRMTILSLGIKSSLLQLSLLQVVSHYIFSKI